MKTFAILLSIFVVQAAVADTPALTVEQMYSFEQVEQVANYLGAKAENPGTKILSCDLSAEKSTQLLSGQVRSLLDTKKNEELTKYNKDPKAYLAKVKGCSSRCTCNGYNLVLADLPEVKKVGVDKDFDALLTDETKKQNSDQALSCAKKLNWFCKSKLRSYLLQ